MYSKYTNSEIIAGKKLTKSGLNTVIIQHRQHTIQEQKAHGRDAAKRAAIEAMKRLVESKSNGIKVFLNSAEKRKAILAAKQLKRSEAIKRHMVSAILDTKTKIEVM